jgi:hypothetical protein
VFAELSVPADSRTEASSARRVESFSDSGSEDCRRPWKIVGLSASEYSLLFALILSIFCAADYHICYSPLYTKNARKRENGRHA